MQAALAAPETPAKGTALRSDLLDTLRVFAGYDLGPPVEFVVLYLQADGDRAFARVMAQRPGGAPIDLAATPMVKRDQIPIDLIDGPRMEAFLARGGGGVVCRGLCHRGHRRLVDRAALLRRICAVFARSGLQLSRCWEPRRSHRT